MESCTIPRNEHDGDEDGGDEAVTRPVASKTRRVRRDECDRGEYDGNAENDGK
jgi:hypothetical protein